ncbi:MAG: 1,4-dihydroxy-2-naphthoate polyprenyltransferase [Deltaproteobacteria bacterium]|nr:1,4-dihydroxy-2-naphthoate polyprenyltransferase [Deltaproteobacteria bacterium]
MNDTLTTPRRWLLAIRPRTLTASIVPVVVGLALAPPRSAGDIAIAAITLAAAFAIQAAVNLANDYYDYVAGIDTHERVGPTRVVQSGLLEPAAVRRGFLACVAAAAALGVVLIARGGLPILVVGVVSLVCAYAYAGGPWPLASHGLGDVFVFAFFGLVPVCGTVWLQRGVVEPGTVAAAVPIGLLAVAILVVNNLRDIATDSKAGKRTLAVRIGERATRVQYVALVVVALAWPLLLAWQFGVTLLYPLLAAPLAIRTTREVLQRSGPALNEMLGATARLQVVYGGMLALGELCSPLL